MARIPKRHRWVFWDVNASALDPATSADHIIPRVLEFGGIDEVRWLIATYGMEGIHRFLRDVGHPELSERTLRLMQRCVYGSTRSLWTSFGIPTRRSRLRRSVPRRSRSPASAISLR